MPRHATRSGPSCYFPNCAPSAAAPAPPTYICRSERKIQRFSVTKDKEQAVKNHRPQNDLLGLAGVPWALARAAPPSALPLPQRAALLRALAGVSRDSSATHLSIAPALELEKRGFLSSRSASVSTDHRRYLTSPCARLAAPQPMQFPGIIVIFHFVGCYSFYPQS